MSMSYFNNYLNNIHGRNIDEFGFIHENTSHSLEGLHNDFNVENDILRISNSAAGESSNEAMPLPQVSWKKIIEENSPLESSF